MLKTGGSAQNQHPCGDSAFNLEAVGYFARPEDVRARSSLEPFAIADERHFSVEDVKRFVFKMVVWYGEAHPGGIIKCSINPNAPLVVSPVDLMTVGIPRNRTAGSSLVFTYGRCSLAVICVLADRLRTTGPRPPRQTILTLGFFLRRLTSLSSRPGRIPGTLATMRHKAVVCRLSNARAICVGAGATPLTS